VAIGTNVRYAAIHQFGGIITRKARSRTLAFTKSGRFMSRKAAGRRKTGSTRIAFARERTAPSRFGMIHIDMPARPYLVVQEEDLAGISKILIDYFKQ